MKYRINALIDEKTNFLINEAIRKKRFIRNKSHLVEIALKEFLENNELKCIQKDNSPFYNLCDENNE